jgi:hypothetical protein
MSDEALSADVDFGEIHLPSESNEPEALAAGGRDCFRFIRSQTTLLNRTHSDGRADCVRVGLGVQTEFFADDVHVGRGIDANPNTVRANANHRDLHIFPYENPFSRLP